MLIQFTVENFLSIRDETTFSMLAAEGDQKHLAHVVADAAGKGRSVLRAAAIYGANAAGKSNLIKAMRFAKELILRGTRSTQTLGVTPFKLETDAQHASKFEFVFRHDGTLYTYGFKLTASQIVEEWLYATPNRTEVRYFERATSEQKATTVEFGAAMTGKSKKQGQFLDFVAQGTRPNQLFLTEAAERNVDVIAPILAWFRSSLQIIPAESEFRDLEIVAHKNIDFTQFLSSFLRAAGTGIEGVTTVEAELDFDRQFPDMPPETRMDIVESLRDSQENGGIMIRSESGERYFITKDEQDKLMRIHFRTQHRLQNGTLVDFAMDEESDGTKRLIHLLPLLRGLRSEHETVVIIDELDRRLHPLLSRLFVEAALDCGEDNVRNQLLFTTHDTNLLDLGLLRRDEIWFVEKDEYGASHLYSLAEFKIRPDLKIEKGYLNGRFGAIPFLGDICSLGWSAAPIQEPATV